MNNIMKRTMKGQLSAMPEAVIILVLIAIIAAVGLLVLSNFLQTVALQTNTCVGTNTIQANGVCTGTAGFAVQSQAYNAVGQGISGVNTVTSFLSLIALVIVASIIIGLVVYAFARGGQSSERF